MKKQLAGWLCILLTSNAVSQQQDSTPRRFTDRLAYKVQVDFQGFSFPFSKLDTYFQNKGTTIGVSYNWNNRGTLQQNINLGTFYNQFHGNAQHISTTFQYNPLHTGLFTAGFSAGAGYMRTGFSGRGLQQGPDGVWFSKDNRKGLLFIPAGLQASVRAIQANKITISPVIAYQVNGLINYTPKSFIVTQSIISIGSKIQIH